MFLLAGAIIEPPVTLQAAIHVLAAQHQNQTLEDILMLRPADHFALTLWADVFSCHCAGPDIVSSDSRLREGSTRRRREQGYAGSESARDVERGLAAFVTQVNQLSS